MTDRPETGASRAPEWLVTLAEARQAPIPPGARSAALMRHGTMVLRFYAPDGSDHQTPHDQDEIYVVISGQGEFVLNGARRQFGPGDAIFAPAGSTHRFEAFSEDFETWVIFYGPAGGEAL